MRNVIRFSELTYSQLKRSVVLTAKCEDRIYPVIAEQGTRTPYVVYSRSISNDIDSKDVGYQDSATVDITCVAETYDDSLVLAEAVLTAMQQRRIESDAVEGIVATAVTLQDLSEDYVDDCYVQNLTFRMSIDKK